MGVPVCHNNRSKDRLGLEINQHDCNKTMKMGVSVWDGINYVFNNSPFMRF